LKKENNNKVCPVERAGGLDNRIRRFLQNPEKILKPFIRFGITVLDVGCGPGFFTVEMAKMLKGSGKVIAADLQEGMLEKLREKIKGTELEQRIKLHKCEKYKINVTEKADFILAFYMVHEVPDQDKLFRELLAILKPGGNILIVEPNFHVSKAAFEKMVNNLTGLGFKIVNKPKVFLSRSVVVTIEK
jgi:ubiquinone/menaquinone biosynthesis C-methylase UbiE